MMGIAMSYINVPTGLCFFLVFAFSSSWADEGDVVNLNAGVTTLRDSNLFRLAPSVMPESVGLAGRSDIVSATTFGLDLNKEFGLQRLVANVNLVDTRYQRNSYLDFQALNYDAKWLWALGVRWTGEFLLDRAEALNSYTDYSNYRVRNVRTVENERFTANYWFHTSWAAVVGVSRTTLNNEQPFLADSDYDLKGYNYGIRYRPVSGNMLTLRAKQLDGVYSKRQFNSASQYDNGFTQNGYELNVDWQLNGKTKLQGRLEYLDRQHIRFASRDYNGGVGSLDVIYAATGKTSLSFGYKHGMEAFQQLVSSYYVVDEFNLGTKWAATASLSASARLGYGKRDYRGEIVALPAGVQQREDKFTRAGFDLAYQWTRWLQLKSGFAFEKRNVNDDRYDYIDRTGFVSLTALY
jgi:exopolysaccharide biosynthesis operon protein EpsL